MSDTHDNLPAIAKAVEEMNKRKVDILIHLGDHVSPFSIDMLGDVDAERHAIYGNNDGDVATLGTVARKRDIRLHRMPHEMMLGDKKAILFHGFGTPNTTLAIIDSVAESGRYGLVLYGHTHKVDVRTVADTLIINPGEVFGHLSGKSSIAVLDTRTSNVNVVTLDHGQ